MIEDALGVGARGGGVRCEGFVQLPQARRPQPLDAGEQVVQQGRARAREAGDDDRPLDGERRELGPRALELGERVALHEEIDEALACARLPGRAQARLLAQRLGQSVERRAEICVEGELPACRLTGELEQRSGVEGHTLNLLPRAPLWPPLTARGAGGPISRGRGYAPGETRGAARSAADDVVRL